MLAILLGILKIILYIILALILIVVLCVLTVLFVPIRYKVEGEKYDDIKLDVRVSFLLHIISFKFNMEDDSNVSFKLFGKELLQKKKHEKKKKTKKKNRKKDNSSNNMNNYGSQNNNNNVNEAHPHISIQEKKEIKDHLQYQKDDVELKENNVEEKDNNENVKSKRVKEKGKNNKSKKRRTQHKKVKKSSKVDKIKQIFSKIKDFIKDEKNKAVIKLVKNKVLKMIKHILPKKFEAKIIIGTGDPASTGYVVGAVSMLYTVTGNKLKVIPDFTEKILQGSFYGKGKIYLIVLLKNTLSIILDKRVRKLYKEFKV